MSCNQRSPMEDQLDSIDQLLAEEGYEQGKILDDVFEFMQEIESSSPQNVYTPMYSNIHPQSNQSSYSSYGSPESYYGQTNTTSPSASSCYSRPESTHSSASTESWYPSECPPSTSSSSSTDSNIFHFTPNSEAVTTQRTKRITRRTRYFPPKSPLRQATRGRGRPMKDNSDGDQTVIRKRIYAREYRKKNQKTHDELFSCLLDFYKVFSHKGINVSKSFPQHKKVISEIVKAL
uniref:Uncharacterized protein n=1 Tax=Panagrolaimus sp. PS1159 TaxID=55785 RepID=A0AC35GKY1_9BILA